MSSRFKLYIYDLAINFAAQVFVLFGGVLSLIFNGLYGLIGWGIFVLIYSVILAKMMQSCMKKGAVFKRYFIIVMLPVNLIAFLVACPFVVVGISQLYIVDNIPVSMNLMTGLVIFLGSVAISLLAVLWNKVIFRQDQLR